MKIQHIFLDFDGTIIDTHPKIIRTLTKILDEYEYNITRNKILKHLGIKLHQLLKEIGVNAGHIDTIRRKFWKHLQKETKKETLHTCVPIEPLIKIQKKYPLTIISNSETKFIKKTTKKLGIKKLFKKIYGAETFTTKEEQIKKLIRKYQIQAQQAIYIGDRYPDIQAAKKANCWAIAIQNKYSWSKKETIKKEKPHYTIKNFKELQETINKINKKLTSSNQKTSHAHQKKHQ